MLVLKNIAERYGNGTLHITTRQGFEIPGIPMEYIDEVNKVVQPVIEGLNINQIDADTGYPASGTRNASACVGNNMSFCKL